MSIVCVQQDSNIGLIRITDKAPGVVTLELENMRGAKTSVDLNKRDLQQLVDALLDHEPHAVLRMVDPPMTDQQAVHFHKLWMESMKNEPRAVLMVPETLEVIAYPPNGT